jgi:hypothetical protein
MEKCGEQRGVNVKEDGTEAGQQLKTVGETALEWQQRRREHVYQRRRLPFMVGKRQQAGWRRALHDACCPQMSERPVDRLA